MAKTLKIVHMHYSFRKNILCHAYKCARLDSRARIRGRNALNWVCEGAQKTRPCNEGGGIMTMTEVTAFAAIAVATAAAVAAAATATADETTLWFARVSTKKRALTIAILTRQFVTRKQNRRTQSRRVSAQLRSPRTNFLSMALLL